jgi:prepilin-type N-terminal cleavage/methylation domain-containing protein
MLSNKKGFTLIELLIVVVIIGILAAIAIPKFANTKEKAYIATMKADLRNLVTAQEAYFADNSAYTTALTTNQYQPSSGVTVTVGAVGSGTFSAVASYAGGTTRTCTILVGTGANDGEPICN